MLNLTVFPQFSTWFPLVLYLSECIYRRYTPNCMLSGCSLMWCMIQSSSMDVAWMDMGYGFRWGLRKETVWEASRRFLVLLPWSSLWSLLQPCNLASWTTTCVLVPLNLLFLLPSYLLYTSHGSLVEYWLLIFKLRPNYLTRWSLELYLWFVSSLVKTAVKAVTAAQLAIASLGIHSVTLDEAIEAMQLTAADMSTKYKETSLSVSANFPFLSICWTADSNNPFSYWLNLTASHQFSLKQK